MAEAVRPKTKKKTKHKPARQMMGESSSSVPNVIAPAIDESTQHPHQPSIPPELCSQQTDEDTLVVDHGNELVAGHGNELVAGHGNELVAGHGNEPEKTKTASSEDVSPNVKLTDIAIGNEEMNLPPSEMNILENECSESVTQADVADNGCHQNTDGAENLKNVEYEHMESEEMTAEAVRIEAASTHTVHSEEMTAEAASTHTVHSEETTAEAASTHTVHNEEMTAEAASTHTVHNEEMTAEAASTHTVHSEEKTAEAASTHTVHNEEMTAESSHIEAASTRIVHSEEMKQALLIEEAIEIAATPDGKKPVDGLSEMTGSDVREVRDVNSESSDVEREKLYPDLTPPEQDQENTTTIQPFTGNQLKSLYYNQQLERNHEFVEHFLQIINPSKNDFYEILLNYYRARNKLVNAEYDIAVLQKEYKRRNDLVWELKEEKLSVQGQCVDKAKVTADITYMTSAYSQQACDQVNKTLGEIRSHLHDQLSLYAYEAQLSRLQVESFLYELYRQNAALCDIPTSSPVEANLHRDTKTTLQVERLKSCLTMLFLFLRKPSKDTVFVKDCHQWTCRLSATLLRIACLEDHLYLLHQVLRCPFGVGKWAAGLVQVVPPPINKDMTATWGNPLLDHYLTVLATILLPIRNREDVLYQMKTMLSPSQDDVPENPWIFVDSDGTEDEDAESCWHYLQENDVMTLLNQVPLDSMFKHILLHSTHDQDKLVYDINATNENRLLRVFAFSTCLIDLLAQGLQHFSLSRYRQLNKRLGKMIKKVEELISDHWESFLDAYSPLPAVTLDRLQLEYDMVVYRAVMAILSAQRLGSWQFLAQLSYKGVNIKTLWNMLLVMHAHCHCDKDMNATEAESMPILHSIDECRRKLKDSAACDLFEQRLMSIAMSEATYLLTTFSNMARCRPNTDRTFIQDVTNEIYEIAYVKSHTRELCSKEGRDLLSSIAHQHPFVLSDLLQITMTTMSHIGMVALYLYKELPLHCWLPMQHDLKLLGDWLLHKEPSSPDHQLARLILDNMNWGYNAKQNDLFLELSIHVHVAVLLTDVYSKYLTGSNVGNLVTDGIKRVASMIRIQESEEQQLANWTWELAQKLCLHRAMLPQITTEWPEAPDLHEDINLQPIALAVEKGFALATYLGLIMSKYSHNPDDFCSFGVKMLGDLAVKSHYLPTLAVLGNILPMFYNKEHYLLENTTFLQVMKLLLQADALKRGMFFSVFPGPVTKLTAGLIQTQMKQAVVHGTSHVVSVVVLWTKLLLKMNHWNTDRDCLCLLDKIAECAFRMADVWTAFQQILAEAYQTLIAKDQEGSMFSSLSTLFGSAKAIPSLIEMEHCGEFPWFAYTILHIEASYEEGDSQLWPRLQQHLMTHENSSVEASLQAVCTEMKYHTSRSSARLCIYRWVHQAMNTNAANPVLPLIWQKFFLLYLGRLTGEAGLPQRGSVGEKFFQPSYTLSLMKRMKKCLQATVAHFEERALQGNQKYGENHMEEESTFATEHSEMNSYNDTRHLSLQYTKFYQTLLFWLDEPRLHDAALYLPALPAQYDSNRLLGIFQNNKTPWIEMVDFNTVDAEISELTREWASFVSHDNHNPNRDMRPMQQKQAGERILESLFEPSDVKDPPAIVEPKSPVPTVGHALLCDQQNLLFTLRADFSLLTDFAKLYASQVARHVGIDCAYIELLPNLYSNETTEAAASATCRSTFNPTHQCKGAAVIVCRYDEAKRNDIIFRKIEENRAQYNQLLIESLLPPPQNVCSAAVHVENTIMSLIKQLQKGSRQSVLEVGTALFFYITTFVSEDTKFYPPTCQFFSSCIEILGQEFIHNNPTQSQPLLQAILQSPHLVGLLAPNFSPCASPELFVSMYQDMLAVPNNQGPDIAVTLLTKFEIDAWLSGGPMISQREGLLEVLRRALCQCGKEPENKHYSVFQVYKVHLRHLVRYQFPDHYGSVLKLLIKGSDNEQLSPEIWQDFLKLLGCPENLEDIKLSTSSTDLVAQLSLENMKETLEWLSSHFLAQRLSCSESTNYGLYPKWKDYVPYFSRFLCLLLTKNVDTMFSHASSGSCDSEAVIYELWQRIVDVFTPWILPIENEDLILSPWIQNDSEAAGRMVEAWVGVVHRLQMEFDTLLPAFARHALSLLWPHYVQRVAKKSVPRHVVQVYNNKLIVLPWEKYFPNIQGVCLMLELCKSKDHHSISQVFLVQIFCRLNWFELITYYSTYEIDEVKHRIYVCFFSLLVRLSLQPDVLTTTSLPALLEQVGMYDWTHLDSSSYSETVRWYEENCDPTCVLVERGSQQALVLRMLKIVAGFIVVPNAAFQPDTLIKWCDYVHCVIHLICKCSHLKDVNPEKFHIPVSNLLTEMESIVGTIADPTEQHTEAVSLCVEVLGLLNQCNSQGTSMRILSDTILGWIEASQSSSLLMPMLSGACRGLAAMKHMVYVAEACMEIHFHIDVSSMDGSGWPCLLAMLQVPDLDQEKFIVEALSQSSYLVLYGYILQLLPLSKSIDDEMACIGRLVFWCSKAKPSSVNEAKMLLWLDKILELIPRQLEFGGKESVVLDKLKKLVPILTSLGEDKTHSGLLGAIGLGKRSQLSLRFRVLTNALATYLSLQVLNNGTLRRQANAPGHISEHQGSRSPNKTSQKFQGPSQHSLQCVQHLDAMHSNKQYLSFKEHIEFTQSFINNPANCILDSQKLFQPLVDRLFPDVNYLAVIRTQSQA